MSRAALWVALIVTSLTASADYRSTFLVGGPEGFFSSSLGYLSPELDDTKRGAIRSQLRGFGDSHIDMMAWSTANDFARVDGVDSNWSNQLEVLNQSGLKPVVWMRSDDSPEVDALPFDQQLAYFSRVIATVDAQTSAYVACLECDEYYSAAQVQQIVAHIRSQTDKPVSVHLSPGTRGKEAYFANADLIHLQTGFNLTEEQFRAEIEYALTLGKPVVVSEYHLYGESAEARRYGDIACSYAGVVGTGNGRSPGTYCGSLQRQEVEPEEEWYEEYAEAIGVGVVALIGGYIAYKVLSADKPNEMLSRFSFDATAYNENITGVMAFQSSERVSVGLEVSESRTLGLINITF